MDHAEALEISQTMTSQSIKVQDGNVEYRLVAFENGNRFPILITTNSPLELPEVGDQFEVRINGRTITGKMTLKRTVMAYSGFILAIITTIVLEP